MRIPGLERLAQRGSDAGYLNSPVSPLLSRSRGDDSFMPSLLGPSMAEEEEDRRSLEAKFAAAVKVIKSLPEEGEEFFFVFPLAVLSFK